MDKYLKKEMADSPMNKRLFEGRDLRGRSFTDCTLDGYSFKGATLAWCNFPNALLLNCNFDGVNMQGVSFRYATLRNCSFKRAKLDWANFEDLRVEAEDCQFNNADLSYASELSNLIYVAERSLQGIIRCDTDIVPATGEFYAWKATTAGVIKLLIPADAKRVTPLGAAKSRASKVVVIGGEGCGGHSPNRYHDSGALWYDKGETVKADSFDPSITEVCTNGIHFFLKRKDAEGWW